MPETARSGSPGASLAVIVCTHNRAALLEQTLRSLANQTVSKGVYEIIVVDDGSTDDTRHLISALSRDVRMMYAYQRNAGLASAKNHGVFLATAPLLLFMDDDDLAAPSLVEHHLRTHDRFPEERYAVLGHTSLGPDAAGDPLMHFVTEVGCCLFAYPQLRDGQVADFTFFWGGRSSCKRAFLLDHGVFNPVFRFGCEDIELGYRLSKHGFQVVYNASARSVMTRRLTFDAFCERSRRQGRSNFVFSRLHDDRVVQDWCGTPGSEAAWRLIEQSYEQILTAARRLDRMAALKRDLGFVLDEPEVACLHRGYRNAFRAATLKGLQEARLPTVRS